MEDGAISKFFRCFNDFVMQSVFLAVNASLGWLNNVSGLILSVPTNQTPSIF